VAVNNSLHVILPTIIVVAGAIAVVLVDLVVVRRKGVLAWVAAAGLVAAASVAVGQWITWRGGSAFWRLFNGGLVWNTRKTEGGFGSMVSLDRYGLFFTILFCIIGVVTIMLADGYLARHKVKPGEFYALLLLVISGMIGMAISTDLIALLVSFELMSLPSYVLAGFLRTDRRSGEAAMKYFINGAFASAVLAFGFALVYGATGATGYDLIHSRLLLAASPTAMLVVALVLVSTGFGFKIAAVPFHGWAPDVYEGAPTPVTAFMSVGIKAGAFAGFLRLMGFALIPAGASWSNILIVLAILTMVVGNVLALPQRNLKRLLAYSSIAHAGYLLLGLVALGQGGGTTSGAGAILFYLAVYTFMNLGAFGVLVLIRNRRPFTYSLDELAGLSRSMPLTALAMALFMLSLTGIPPLAGFWAKVYIFTALVDAHMTWLAIVAVIMSAVSAFYYLRVVWYMYFREVEEAEGEQPAPELLPSGAGVSASMSVAALGVLALGVYPGPVIAAAQGAVRVLFGS
jgi:NADH-quinone oxidoreductase subunit N